MQKGLFTILVAILAVHAAGCASPAPKEPPDGGSFPAYEDLRPAKIFRKLSFNPGVDVRDCMRVRVSEIGVPRSVALPWRRSSFEGDQNLSIMVGEIRQALTAELATSFQVLPHDSFIDEKTIVVKALVTQLSLVKLPLRGHETPKGLSTSPPEAAIEIGCWRGRDLKPFIKIKDWRRGRQVIQGPPVKGRGRYGDSVSIFRLWGQRLTDLLVKAGRNPSAIK